jgi:hypothetical protein
VLNLEHLFTIDKVTGRFFWKNPPRHHAELAGTEAGCPITNHSGKVYWVIRIGGRGYKRGRLMYLYEHGRWPMPCVDHENGNSLDDRPNNLREATVTQNAQNHKKRARRIKLPMGVRFVASSGRYQARIGVNGKQIALGAYDTPEEAQAIYLESRKEHFNEFA